MDNEIIAKELTKFNITDAAIALLSKQYMPLKIEGVTDKNGHTLVHNARMVVKNKRIEVEKKRKELKEDSLRYGQAVDGEAKRIIGLLAPIEKHLSDEETAVDDALEAIKAEKARIDELHIQERRDRLAALGVGFNGQMWSYGTLNLPEPMLKVVGDDQFETLFSKFQEAIEAEAVRVASELEARLVEAERLTKIAEEQEVERKRLEVIAQEQAKKETARQNQLVLEQAERLEKEAKLHAEEKRIAAEKAEWEREKEERKRDVEIAKQLEFARKEAADKARIQVEERVKRETEEKVEKERLAKIAAEKKVARQPDKVKLLGFADYLEAMVPPTMKTQEGQEILSEFEMEFIRITKTLRDQTEVM